MKEFLCRMGTIALIGLPVIAFGDTTTAETDIRIGIMMPFSGDVAVFGEKARKGFQLAEQKLPKKEFEIIYEDTGGTGARQAVAAASKLVNVDKIDVLLGPYGPEQTIPVAPIAQKRNVPIFSYSLCSSKFAGYENVYCSFPSSELQLESLRPLLKSEQVQTLSLIDESSEFGLEAFEIMKRNAVTMGFQIVGHDEISAADTDFRTLVTRIKKDNPDAVFVAVTNPAQAFTFLKQLYDMGYRGKRIAFIDYDDKYLAEFGGIMEGLYIPGALPANFEPDFAEAYKITYHEEPDLYSALAYDLLNFVVQAIRKNRDRPLSGSWIRELSDFQYMNPAIPGFRYLSDRTVKFPLEVRVAKGRHFVTTTFN